MSTLKVHQFILNILGLILGIYWFGWWFLLPAFLASIHFKNV